MIFMAWDLSLGLARRSRYLLASYLIWGREIWIFRWKELHVYFIATYFVRAENEPPDTRLQTQIYRIAQETSVTDFRYPMESIYVIVYNIYT